MAIPVIIVATNTPTNVSGESTIKNALNTPVSRGMRITDQEAVVLVIRKKFDQVTPAQH